MPGQKIVKQGACSALINQPDLAKEIILAAKEGTHLPVSVKTRTGISAHNTEEWMKQLIEANPDAITLHGRTQSMQSDGEANWDEIARAVKVRSTLNPAIPVYGNGDVFSMEIASDRLKSSGADGIMVGRGIFYDPWIFNPVKKEATEQERIDLLLKHTRLFESIWKNKKNFNILKRFYKFT